MVVNQDNKSFVTLPLCNRSSSLEDFYKLLFSIRTFELTLLEMFDKGLLSGTTHTCLGQETSAVGVMAALDLSKDIVFSNHRGHGHFLAYCGEIERLLLEVMGKSDGVCAGRGGSQHLHFRNFYSNGIQGSIVPVATGMAMAEKKKATKAVTVVFLGDGTLGEGVIYESMNIAALWNLPILFVIDNNGYAQSTPCKLQVAGSIPKRAEAFGIDCKEVNGIDVQEVCAAACGLVDTIREQCQPRCLIINSVRMGPHSKGDDTRSEEELEKVRKRDPLKKISTMIDQEIRNKIEDEVIAIVKNLAKF